MNSRGGEGQRLPRPPSGTGSGLGGSPPARPGAAGATSAAMLASVARSTRGAQAYVPQYVRIRDEITRRIEAGELQPGDRIPSLREMCEEFGVSSITARRALLDLLNEGIVERRGGLGAFVTGARRRLRVAVVIIGYS